MGSIYHVEKEWSSAFQRVTNSRTRTGFACFCFVTFRGRLVFPMFEPGATTITKHKRRRRRRDRKTCSSSIFWFYYFLFEFFSSFARSPKTMERVRTLFVLPSVFVYRSSSFLSLFIFFFFLCDFIFHCRVAPPYKIDVWLRESTSEGNFVLVAQNKPTSSFVIAAPNFHDAVRGLEEGRPFILPRYITSFECPAGLDSSRKIGGDKKTSVTLFQISIATGWECRQIHGSSTLFSPAWITQKI